MEDSKTASCTRIPNARGPPAAAPRTKTLAERSIGTSTIQSRAIGGVAAQTLIFALPGSTGACRDAWGGILVHQLDSRYRPCNFAELLPRM